MSLMKLPALLLAFTLATAPWAAAASTPPPTAAALAAALQKKYEAVRGFSANFTHTYTGGILQKTVTEHGHVDIRKPGLMRWDYASPHHKLFVSDGTKIYSYLPEDRQVIISSMPSANEATVPALFLAGRGNLTRDFTASLVDWPGAPAGTWALKLIPKQRQRDYDWLILVVERQSLRLRMLVSHDAEGGTSTIAFSDLKENVDLPDRLFTFKIPHGVDVVPDNPGF